LEDLVLTAVWSRKYKTVPAGSVGAPVMARGAMAKALAGSKREIMAGSMMANEAGHNFSPGLLFRLIEPSGIAMPPPPNGSEKPSSIS
jgi:hypothetical protein